MTHRTALFAAVSLLFAVGCANRNPQAGGVDCPADAPCFVSVIAPSGSVGAPGPFTMLVEVTGPQRIEGVGLVMSVNGAASSELWLARAGQGDNLWHVPDLDNEDVDPPTAKETAQALASLQPGDRVTYLLWAYDQSGAQSQYTGTTEAGSMSFVVMGVDGVASDAGEDLDGGSPTDASAAPSPTVDAG